MDLLDSIRDKLVNQSPSTADVLHMAMELAHEYQSPVLRRWAEFELNGYPEFAQMPLYRLVRISLAGTFRDSTGQETPGVAISAARLPAEIRDSINNLYIHSSAAALEDALASGHSMFYKELPLEAVGWLSQCNQMAGGIELVAAYQQISRSLYIDILHNIRTRLLGFVLKMKGSQMASDGERAHGGEPDDIARNIVNNITIYGNNNVVAGGANIRQEVNPVQQGDLNSLVRHLQAHQVPDEDIQALQNAVASEPNAINGEPGPSVKAWIGGMITKAVSGVWRTTTEKASALLVNAINTYYGI